MAKVFRKPVIVTHGNEYSIGDSVNFRLKNGVLVSGIIKNIRFAIGKDSFIDLYISQNELTINADTIDD